MPDTKIDESLSLFRIRPLYIDFFYCKPRVKQNSNNKIKKMPFAEEDNTTRASYFTLKEVARHNKADVSLHFSL
jgi:hypothetical protein